MELENVNSKTNAALTTGIIGTAGFLLTGFFAHGGLFNWNNNSQLYATKEDLAYSQTIAAKDSEIALLKSEQNTEVKITDVYERVMTRVNQNQRDQADWNASQSVINAQIAASIATNNSSIAALQNTCNNLTKIVIPADNVCPKPMPQYNSWTAPTTPTTTA